MMQLAAQLPIESSSMLLELGKKSKAEVLQTVSSFGGEIDGDMTKQLMLELLFDMLSENARAETGTTFALIYCKI